MSNYQGGFLVRSFINEGCHSARRGRAGKIFLDILLEGASLNYRIDSKLLLSKRDFWPNLIPEGHKVVAYRSKKSVLL